VKDFCPDLRLEIYKGAFPEMIRPGDKDTPIHKSALASIQYVERCTGIEDGLDTDCASALNPCGPCHFRRLFDKLTPALTSHFARDPDLREEFLHEYFSLVQFHWNRKFERGDAAIPVFSQFFETYREHVKSLKHLTLQLSWKYTGLVAYIPSRWLRRNGRLMIIFGRTRLTGV
jgi:hypothetical protein